MAASDEFIEILSPNAEKRVEKLNALLLETVGNIDKVNAASKKTPSQSDAAVKQLNAQLEAQAKVITNLQSKYSELAAKQQRQTDKAISNADRQRVADLKLQQAREKNVDNFTKNETKQALALAKQESLYTKIQAKIGNLTGEYNNLAARKEIGIRLTDREAVRYDFLSSKITGYQNILKKADADIGKFQRNVGNYASGFNPLGSSIGRIAQELPNLGQSFQIFAMSIGNNVAAFKDAVDGIVERNKILKAEGKGTTSVLSQIGSSLLSLNTLLYVGIAVFVAYGKEIGEFFSKIVQGSKSLNVAKESFKAIGEAAKEAQKNTVEELNALQANLAIAKNANIPLKEREIAYKNLNDQYPFYFENLTKEQVLAGETAEAEKALTEAILSRAKANAAVGKITENQSKIIDLEEARLQLTNELTEAKIRQNAATAKANQADLQRGESNAFGSVSAISKVEDIQKKLVKNQKDINDATAYNNRLTSYALENQTKAIGLDYKQEKTKKAKAKSDREDLEAVKMQDESIQGLIIRLREQAELMKKLQQSAGSFEEWREFQKIIDDIGKSIKFLTEGSEELRQSADKGVKSAEAQNQAYLDQEARMAALRKATEEYIATISNSTLGDLGMGSLQQFFDGTFDRLMAGADTLAEKFAVTFKAITDVAMEAFSFIEEMQNAQFNQQYDRLEREKDVALQFAGESAGAREEIERQYEERRKAIQRRQAEAEKKNALFQIIIKTAQGVVAALASLNIPLSIAIGVIGAAQAALVASQPIPEFADGGTHTKGGLMKVNDAKGSNYRETIVTPDGKVMQPLGRDVIMNAPKGTKIYTPKQWDALQFNNDLNGILMNNSIGNAPVVINQGITQEQITAGMVQAISSMPQGDTFQAIYDERGMSLYRSNANSTTQSMNARKHVSGQTIGRNQ